MGLKVAGLGLFPKILSRVFPALAVANTGSCVGPRNKIGLPADSYRQLRQILMLSDCEM